MNDGQTVGIAREERRHLGPVERRDHLVAILTGHMCACIERKSAAQAAFDSGVPSLRAPSADQMADERDLIGRIAAALKELAR